MKTKGKTKSALLVVAVACVGAYAAACAGEDWGGPQGAAPPPPPPPTAFHAEAAEGTMTDPSPHGRKPHGRGQPSAAGESAPGEASAAGAGAGAGAAGETRAVGAPSDGDAGAANGVVPRVEASVSSGKLAGFDEAAAGLRSAMKACVAGKGPEGAVVELMAQVGPKGTIVRSDHVGGSEFAEGAVPCLVKLLEGAQFKKPDLDAGPPPRVVFRVKMQRE